MFWTLMAATAVRSLVKLWNVGKWRRLLSTLMMDDRTELHQMDSKSSHSSGTEWTWPRGGTPATAERLTFILKKINQLWLVLHTKSDGILEGKVSAGIKCRVGVHHCLTRLLLSQHVSDTWLRGAGLHLLPVQCSTWPPHWCSAAVLSAASNQSLDHQCERRSATWQDRSWLAHSHTYQHN